MINKLKTGRGRRAQLAFAIHTNNLDYFEDSAPCVEMTSSNPRVRMWKHIAISHWGGSIRTSEKRKMFWISEIKGGSGREATCSGVLEDQGKIKGRRRSMHRSMACIPASHRIACIELSR